MARFQRDVDHLRARCMPWGTDQRDAGCKRMISIIVNDEIACGHSIRQLDFRHLGAGLECLGLCTRQNRSRRKLVGQWSTNHARNVVSVLVRHNDESGTSQRACDLHGCFGIVRFIDASAKKPVDLPVHAGIDHERPIGVHGLKNGPRLNAGIGRSTLYRKIPGTTALRKFQNVQAQWTSARHEGSHPSYIIQICGPAATGLWASMLAVQAAAAWNVTHAPKGDDLTGRIPSQLHFRHSCVSTGRPR